MIKPDPEGMNEQRAALAEKAIEPFIEEFGDDITACVDLLTDMMHWCDFHDVDFDDALRQARNHYTAETEEEEE